MQKISRDLQIAENISITFSLWNAWQFLCNDGIWYLHNLRYHSQMEFNKSYNCTIKAKNLMA